MPKINYILLIYRNLFLTPIHASKLLLLNSLMEFLGTNTDIHLKEFMPGENCFINVRDFNNPYELSLYLNDCCNDENLYQTFFG